MSHRASRPEITTWLFSMFSTPTKTFRVAETTFGPTSSQLQKLAAVDSGTSSSIGFIKERVYLVGDQDYTPRPNSLRLPPTTKDTSRKRTTIRQKIGRYRMVRWQALILRTVRWTSMLMRRLRAVKATMRPLQMHHQQSVPSKLLQVAKRLRGSKRMSGSPMIRIVPIIQIMTQPVPFKVKDMDRVAGRRMLNCLSLQRFWGIRAVTRRRWGEIKNSHRCRKTTRTWMTDP